MPQIEFAPVNDLIELLTIKKQNYENNSKKVQAY